MQAQLMTLLGLADGQSRVTETIFENRFMHAAELVRLGARIDTEGSTATIRGVRHYQGAQVMASDLRASAALVLAGLAARRPPAGARVPHPAPAPSTATGVTSGWRPSWRASARSSNGEHERAAHAGAPQRPAPRRRAGPATRPRRGWDRRRLPSADLHRSGPRAPLAVPQAGR